MSQTTTHSSADVLSTRRFAMKAAPCGVSMEEVDPDARGFVYYLCSDIDPAVAALLARNAEMEAERNELERLCDATYVQQGADAYHHACEVLEAWQEARFVAGKDRGCEGSLCDGLSWLQSRVDQLEAENVAMGETLSIIAGIAPALGKKSRVRGALTHATSAAAAQLAALARTPAAKGNDDE